MRFETVESRLGLNLSPEAFANLKIDEDAMMPPNNVKRDSTVKSIGSGFLNAVFLKYYREAKATAGLYLEKKRGEIIKQLSVIKMEDDLRSRIADKMIIPIKEELKAISANQVKGVHFNISLNTEVIGILESDNISGTSVHTGSFYPRSKNDPNSPASAGKYIKAVLEEYASLPYYKRELIFYRDKAERIRSAIERGVFISYYERTDLNPNGTPKLNAAPVYFFPCRLGCDEWSTRNYVSGLIMRKSGLRPVSIKLAQITNIKELPKREEPFRVSDADKKMLFEKITENGVMFIGSASPKEITVWLSELGKDLYDAIGFMRPMYTSCECSSLHEINGFIITVCCTKTQAEYYFIKFGKNAVILSPDDLRQRFIDIHNKQCELYECHKSNQVNQK